MPSYDELPGFQHLYFEDSWVLGVWESPDRLQFDIEAALTQDHPRWRPPNIDEQHAYQRVAVVFHDPCQVEWIQRPGRPAVDARGELDYGHIDVFTWSDEYFELAGDWGHVRIHGPKPVVLEP